MIHKFRCETCKSEFDVYLRLSDDIIATCPKCQLPSKKVFGFSGFKLAKSFPYFNIQLGDFVSSRYDEDKKFEKIGAVRV